MKNICAQSTIAICIYIRHLASECKCACVQLRFTKVFSQRMVMVVQSSWSSAIMR